MFVAVYRLDIIESLARQMAFAPTIVRDAQIAAAEDLLLSLDPQKGYDATFIVYRITGYQAKPRAKDLLTGLALQHDLGLLIEQVSDTLAQKTTDRAEPVLMIDDLVARFNVTSKTIQRWRRRGLSARRFVFPDGKRRVGFRLNIVERFLNTHQECAERGANFSQIDSSETGVIFRHARRLLGQGCCVDDIARRIARTLNRSPLTIRSTLQKHDAENLPDAILPRANASLTACEQEQVCAAAADGVSLSAIASRMKRNRCDLYSTVLAHRLQRVTARRVKFIDDPLYHGPDAETAITEIGRQAPLESATPPEASRMPGDLPAYLRSLYRFPLLSPARERALFLEFNYRKFCFVTARRRLDPSKMRWRDIVLLERLLARAVAVKNQIVQANLRLVVSVAKKHTRPGLQLIDLVSEGNVTLLRAVESFDAHKGHKFSTYATFALMKGFARAVPQMLYGDRDLLGGDVLLTTADRHSSPLECAASREEVRTLLARLTPRATVGAMHPLRRRTNRRNTAGRWIGNPRPPHRARSDPIARKSINKYRISAENLE